MALRALELGLQKILEKFGVKNNIKTAPEATPELNVAEAMLSGDRAPFDYQFGSWVSELGFPTEEFPRPDSPIPVREQWESRMEIASISEDAIPLPTYILLVHQLYEEHQLPKEFAIVTLKQVFDDPRFLTRFALADAKRYLSGLNGKQSLTHDQKLRAKTKIATASAYYELLLIHPGLVIPSNVRMHDEISHLAKDLPLQ